MLVDGAQLVGRFAKDAMLGLGFESGFGSRMRGSGEFADLLRRRFDIACERLGFNSGRRNRALDTARFRGALALF